MDRLQQLISSFRAQEISKDDFKRLVIMLFQIVQLVQDALDGVETSVHAGVDPKKVDEVIEAVNAEREQKISQFFLEIQEEEKQADALGHYGLVVQKALNAPDGVEISVIAGEDFKVVDEAMEVVNVEREQKISQNFLDIKEEEKQVDALGQYGLEEGQFGLEEFSSRNLDLPAKGTLVSFALNRLQAGRSFQIDRELATFSVKLLWWAVEAGNINSLLENLRKGEG